MNHIFVALIFCIACTQSAGIKRESEREQDGFVGPVKKVFVEWSSISGRNYPAGTRCRYKTNVYDQSGRLMRQSVYPGDRGRDEIINDYSYAADGSRTETSQTIRAKDSPPPPPPMAKRSTSDDKGPTRMVFKYDPSFGKIIESRSIRPSGKVIYILKYSHDDKGRVIEMTSYDDDGKVSSRRVYGYTGDEKVPSSFAYYDGKGNVHERTIYSDYEFNPQGDWVRRKEITEETFNRKSVSLKHRAIEYHSNEK